MAHHSSLLFVVLTAVVFTSVSANTVAYNVSHEPCVEGSTCPQGNPPGISRTFVLDGVFSPNVSLTVGDTLEFDLITTQTGHPLTICQNSTGDNFCAGVAVGDELNTPITYAGNSTSVTFNTVGTYYYGCHIHPGMGALIFVVQPVIPASPATRGGGD